ncbi:MAG TPA: RNA 2',3'-cyclic phosphodiesterase [Steroidobacteraceae bacterium]
MTDRLFFAFWPDDALRDLLRRRVPPLLEGVRGKAQRPDQWHVTAEFLGPVPADRQPSVWAAADRIDGVPFTIEFDLLDHWRRPQVFCLSASSTPAPLARLVIEMRAALLAEGFVPESRDYRPHVTLARKARTAPKGTLPDPIAWPVDRFALVRSQTDPAGSRYEPLRWWNLRG